MTTVKKVLVIGLDGLDPKVAEPLLAAGELPNLARLQKQGGYARLQTTYPAQTPVAWSTFATGTNPGGQLRQGSGGRGFAVVEVVDDRPGKQCADDRTEDVDEHEQTRTPGW